jgi:hypothetical protein
MSRPDLIAFALDAAPVVIGSLSLTANIAQYLYARSRRSAVDKQAAIRAPLANVLATLEPPPGGVAASDWPVQFARVESLAVALRQLDSALIGARGAPLAVVLTVTRLLIASDAVLRWRGHFAGLVAGRSKLPERDYRQWSDRRAAEADLSDLRQGLGGGRATLRAYMALLNA